MEILVYCIFTILLFIFLGIIFILVFPRILFGKLKYNRNEQSDAIVILGHPALKNGSPSPILRERINKGIELYNKKIATRIICTGSAVKNKYIEAEVIRNELIKSGISSENIICESRSRSTWENIKYIKDIMEKENIGEIVIVSSPAHVRRASIYAEKFGIKYTIDESKIPKEIPKFFQGLLYIYINYGIIKYIIKNLRKEKV
jgi:uncharacterized SAM-binding protein YcdF (DUF218 family)